jgi:hypothetical protein
MSSPARRYNEDMPSSFPDSQAASDRIHEVEEPEPIEDDEWRGHCDEPQGLPR